MHGDEKQFRLLLRPHFQAVNHEPESRLRFAVMPQAAPAGVWSMRFRGPATSSRLLLHSRDRGGKLAVVCRLKRNEGLE